LLFLIGFLTLLGIILLWISGRQRRLTGLPTGRVIYSDHDYWGIVEKPLYDPIFNLTGKPDFIIEQDDVIIPVEVKSGRVKTAPYDSHIYQLAAYCLLIQQSFGVRPPYGILHYPNQDIAIEYTPQLEQEIIDLLRDVRSQERRRNIGRSHQSSIRCRRCSYLAVCDQAMS
jgi:CRISPR-associated exonuclease Cas4